MIQQLSRLARVFAGNQISFFQDAHRPISNVFQVADWSRHNVQHTRIASLCHRTKFNATTDSIIDYPPRITAPREERSMKLESLHDLFVEELQDLYSAENMIIKALPKMIDKASAADLKGALTEHLEQTKVQADRLDQIFDQLGDELDRKGRKCKGVEGIIKENKTLLSEDAEPEVLDAGIIAGAQKIEHYEIAAYGTVRNYANLLGRNDWMQILEVTLEEEKQADKKLTQLAEHINVQAKAA